MHVEKEAWMSSVLKEAVAKYLERGWRPIPLAPKKKNPYHKAWQETNFGPDDFGESDNVGIRIIGGLIDLDLDCIEAVACAGIFLPATQAIFGRASKPRSHYLYTCGEITETQVFKDHRGIVLLEIRTGGDHETMVPPSIHPSGEEVKWDVEGDAVEVDRKIIERSASLLAATALIAQRYPPPGARHDWSLALSGALKQLSVTKEEAEKIYRASTLIAGDDHLNERLEEELYPTYAKAENDPMAGFKKLAGFDKELAVPLRRFLGDAISVKGFIANQNGSINSSKPENMTRALKRMKYFVRYDKFGNRKMLYQEGREVGRRLEDQQLNAIRLGIDKTFGFLAPKELFADVIDNLSREDSFHPVQDYLEQLATWDGIPRLDTWLTDICGAENNPFNQAVGRIPLLAAVARVYNPGVKMDELLILESIQGSGKSTVIANLCPNEEWYSDDLPLGVDSKQVIERTEGRWIVEVAELFGIGKREVDQVKAFLSRRVDGPVRLAYGRESIIVPRQFICIGTTNKFEYLKDYTGSRRFWPVKVADKIDTDKMLRARDMIWAEAVARQNESLRLDPGLYEVAMNEQESRDVVDPWQEVIVGIVKKPPQHIQKNLRGGNFDNRKLRMTTEELWDILGIPISHRDVRGQERLTGILQKLKFKKMKINRKGSFSYGWGRNQ